MHLQEAADGDPPPLWLGLDLSTQSLTGAVLQGDGIGRAFNEPIVLESVNYEVKVVCIFHVYMFACFCNTCRPSPNLCKI